MEVHNAVIKWSFDMRYFELKIIDKEKANNKINGIDYMHPNTNKYESLLKHLYQLKFWQNLYGTIAKFGPPDKERCNPFGVQITLDINAMGVDSFSIRVNGRNVEIVSPSTHLEKTIPPCGLKAVKLARIFYKSKLKELEKLLKSYSVI